MGRKHSHDQAGGLEFSNPLHDPVTGEYIADLKTYRCSCGELWQTSESK